MKLKYNTQGLYMMNKMISSFDYVSFYIVRLGLT